MSKSSKKRRNKGKPGIHCQTVATSPSKSALTSSPALWDFYADAGTLSIYLSEHWYTPDSASGREYGTLGLVLWYGSKPEFTALPSIKSNLSPEAAIKALQHLTSCQKALPVILTFPSPARPEQSCSDIFAAVITFILGWFLPQEGQECQVRILLQQAKIPGSGKTTTKSSFFKKVLRD